MVTSAVGLEIGVDGTLFNAPFYPLTIYSCFSEDATIGKPIVHGEVIINAVEATLRYS